MLRFLLDTNVVSEPFAKRPDAGVLRRLEEHEHESAIAAPVLHELRYGAALLEPSRRRAMLERYIDDVVLRLYPVLAYDEAAAGWHAEQRARLTRLGRPAPYADGCIAAIANVNGLVLVTSNVRDLKPFTGLQVACWKR